MSEGKNTENGRRLKRYRSSDMKDKQYKYIKIENPDTVRKTVQQKVHSVAKIVMDNHFEFVSFKPSIIAQTIIEKARLLSDIKKNS